MNTTRKMLAGLCAFLFVTSGVAALLLFNVERKAFSPGAYKQTFRQQGLYENASGLIAETIMTSAGNPNDAFVLLSVLSRDELELVISTLLPPQELETLTDGLLDSIFAFLNGDTDSVTVPLRSFKQNLTGEGGVRAIAQVMQLHQDCSTAQLLQMGLGVLATGQGAFLCKPPDNMMGLVMPLIGTQLQFIAGGLPDEMTLFTAAQSGTSRDFRPQLNRIRTVMKLSLILPLVFLLAVTFLVVRSLEDWLKWWGIPSLVMGILVTITAFAAAPLIPSLMGSMIAQGTPDMPTAFQELARNLAGALTREILRPAAIQGIILTLTGSVMVVINAIINRNG